MGMFDQQPGMFSDPMGFGAGAQGGLASILGDYLRSVVSGQVAAGGVLGQNNYDPSATFAQNALNPKAIENATDIAFGIGPGSIRAYHGSPYDFEKFDLSKIGTGEGAQAYGHGLYFAERPEVAEAYRQPPSQAPVGQSGYSWVLAKTASNKAGDAGLLGDEAKQSALNWLNEQARSRPTDRQSIYDAMNNYDALLAPKGRMYEVNINADPDAFLNWDKPLSGQSDAVQRMAAQRGISQLRDPVTGLPAPEYGEPIGAELYSKVQRQFFDKNILADSDARQAGQPIALRHPAELAAEGLNQAGIPGIRYLDQGSRGAGGGTSNYVVFDPSIIEILRKYGILGPVAAPGALMPFMGDQQ